MLARLPPKDTDWPDYVIGTPDRVRQVINRMAVERGADEFMVQDFIDRPGLQLRNYERLARAFA